MSVMFISAVVGIVLASCLTLATYQNNSVIRCQTWNAAMPVAESGLEEALSQIQQNGPGSAAGGMVGNLAADGWTLTTGGYSKQRNLGSDAYYAVVISTNVPPLVSSLGAVLVPATGKYISRTVTIQTVSNPMFVKGLVVKKTVTSNGNSVMADAFDSANPLYSTNGQYITSKATDGGGIATLSGAANALNFGGGNIYGPVATGPGGSIPGGLDVGSHAWQASNSGVEPGWFTTDMNVSFPDVTAPYASDLPPVGGTVGGVAYGYVLSTGNYFINSGTLGGKVLVTGNATLYVTAAATVNFSPTLGSITVQNNASLKLYVGSGTAVLPNLVNSTGNAAGYVYFGLPTNTNIQQTVNADFVGTMYAPEAKWTLGGNGQGSMQHIIGAGIVDSVFYNDSFVFDYDINLGRISLSRGYLVAKWREL